MTAATTFKEFVEEEGLTFAWLDVDSRTYSNLVKRFNEVKVKLRAEEETRWYESVRPLLNEQSTGGGRKENGTSPRRILSDDETWDFKRAGGHA